MDIFFLNELHDIINESTLNFKINILVMIVYKVIIQIKEDRAQEWFEWMSTKHIPDVVNTGHFVDFSFSRLLPNGTIPEPGYVKFQIEYFSYGLEDYLAYDRDQKSALQAEHNLKYGNDFIATREIYEDVTGEMKDLYEKIAELQH